MFIAAILLAAAAPAAITFDTVEINHDAGITPAVALSDIDGDKDLDLVAMSNDDISWYENPGWERHVIVGVLENLNVCMALQDLTGDGLPEITAGADWQFENTKSGGSLHVLVRGEDVRQPWQHAQILSEPNIHRIRWADVDADGKRELFVAPLKGRDSSGPDFKEHGVRLLQLTPPKDLLKDAWPAELVTQDYHVMHNLIPFRRQSGGDALIVASFEGLHLLSLAEGKWSARNIATGNPQPWPRSGSSEVKVGRLAQDIPVIATIEPWHGNQVVVYTPDAPAPLEQVRVWQRHVLDDSFNQGHALGWADFDGDGREELAAGHREPSPKTQKVGLHLYRFEAFRPGGNLNFERQPIDEGGMATEDLAIGDIDGDGDPDIFAGGRATHNLKVYLNQR